jgi:hypothetical protein
MRDQPPPQQPALFSYATGVSLRVPERRGSRLPLVLGVLLLTGLVAGLVLVGFLWLATADYAALFAAALDSLRAAASRK